jgi:hypothetical protein
MEKTLYELRTFHLTGRKIDEDFRDLGELDLVPALLSQYRDLTRIRHDYPMVLVEGGGDSYVQSLTSVINHVLRGIAPEGMEGERARQNLLSLELEIRAASARNGRGTLSKLWDTAVGTLLSAPNLSGEEKELLEADLARARRASTVDGAVVECSGEAPGSLFVHAWKAIEDKRARTVLETLEGLIVGLSGILQADHLKSAEGLSAEALQSSVGDSFEDEFDFAAMSESLITSSSSRESHLPAARRERIRFALSVLESQRFFASRLDDRGKEGDGPYPFVVDSCTDVLKIYRDRIPHMLDFVKAVRIAELELANEYDEEKHDPFFEQFDEGFLAAEDISFFPSYLVCLEKSKYDDASKAALVEILSSDLPIKVLFQPDDAFGSSSVESDRSSTSGWEQQLAKLAMSLGGAYVLQAAASSLYTMSEAVSAGLLFPGPALFSVFSGSTASFPNLAPYLVSAAAAQSRALPCFVYDPGAGTSWASRFRLDGNPRVESDWPVDSFQYEDPDLQAISEDLAFSFVDFAASDKRFSGSFVSVPQASWHANMVPASEYLQLEDAETGDKVPYLLMVDGENTLHRVVVTHNVISAARRCAQAWRNLQELGGINNSHALALLERERQVWEEEKEREIEELRGALGEQVAPSEAPALEGAEAAEALEPEEPSGPIEEACIETPRCNACDECTKKNPKMFAYNENKQAYIADITAGTFRDLVESAELCKVAIIHPGKPRNLDEPNLEELIKRAEPFNVPLPSR